MKRSSLSSIALILAIIISTTLIAHADENSDTATSSRFHPLFAPLRRAEAVRDQVQDRRAEFQENMETKQGEFEERFDEFRRERIAQMIALMKERFLAAIERLRGIADRIDTRIEKIEDESDKDLSEAKEHLSTARRHLNEAEGLIEGVDAEESGLTEGATTTGQRFGVLRALFTEAKEEIKAAHESLRRALRGMAQIQGNARQATTTTSSN